MAKFWNWIAAWMLALCGAAQAQAPDWVTAGEQLIYPLPEAAVLIGTEDTGRFFEWQYVMPDPEGGGPQGGLLITVYEIVPGSAEAEALLVEAATSIADACPALEVHEEGALDVAGRRADGALLACPAAIQSDEVVIDTYEILAVLPGEERMFLVLRILQAAASELSFTDHFQRLGDAVLCGSAHAGRCSDD